MYSKKGNKDNDLEYKRESMYSKKGNKDND